MDYFELGGNAYLAMADRYSGWLSIKYFSKGTATLSSLVSTLREWFMVFGAPIESEITQEFLRNWGICHRVSSVAFPHSNCRAELAVKTAKKKLIRDVGSHGSLDRQICRSSDAIQEHTHARNLSPAQILLGRKLRDFFPFINGNGEIRKEWRIAAYDREKALAKRHISDMERLSLKTHELPEFHVGDSVLIQNQVGNYPSKWERMTYKNSEGSMYRYYFEYLDTEILRREESFLSFCT